MLAGYSRGGSARRLAVVLVIASCALSSAAAASKASPSGLNVLVTGNCFADAVAPLATAIQAQPGVANVTTFDTSTGTPAAATLTAQDLVVSLGDDCVSYADQAAWGDRLADYVDAGGVVLQAAYDNWEMSDAHPTGRFASGGYAPLELGPNDNLATTLGALPDPSNPIVQGLGTFPNSDNTSTALAPGATLLAKWADGRNAIAVKGRVVATSSSADEDSALPALARLAINTADYFAAPNTKITKSSISSKKHTAAFRFAAVGSATGFQCALQRSHRRAAFKACHSPKTYKHLKPGKYVFQVRAVGAGGRDPSPAKKSFKIKK